MQFNSYVFVLLFMPLTIALFFIVSKSIGLKAGNVFLLVASLVYYIYAGKKTFLILCLSICINYIVSTLVNKRKIYLVLGIVFNVGLLLYFKYYNFFVVNINETFEKNIIVRDILLPLGISFITFQQISYIVSKYRGELEKHNFIDYLLFVLYFPKLIMGPLIEPQKFFCQINNEERRYINTENFIIGIRMFNMGLFKKLIFADTFAKAANYGFANSATITSMETFIVMLAYTFQIYFDFSGYSDMAIGISKILNINLPMNFNSPYKAYSIRDFWKRWHMSLTNFLTKYIYFPLGGSRKGITRTYINMITVFIVSGFWHGANWTFILWGILHGVISVIERIFNEPLERVHDGFKWFVTFIITNVLWLLFRAESISQWKNMLKTMIKFNDLSIGNELINCFGLAENHVIYRVFHLLSAEKAITGFSMIVLLMVAFIVVMLFENNYNRKYKNNIVTMLASGVIFIWSIISLGGESSFVYFGF